jgi:hypothetical protein
MFFRESTGYLTGTGVGWAGMKIWLNKDAREERRCPVSGAVGIR